VPMAYEQVVLQAFHDRYKIPIFPGAVRAFGVTRPRGARWHRGHR
jgi:hypothetical protein